MMIGSLLLAAATLSGVVHDTAGGVVVGASVVVRQTSGGEQQTTTGPDGRFSIETSEGGDLTVVVRAGGFAEKQERVPAGASEINIVLSAGALLETVTVTATRMEQPLGDVPASVSVLTSEEIKESPALVADDVLRQIPTFSLFRRSSSLVANPTAQGVSLRGIGPSGQSRTLVLLDGIPFNDPFGGWVYWTRIPLISVDRVEVAEDPTSSLYGNSAMGGVVNIITTRPSVRTIEINPQYASQSSPKLDFFGSDRWNKVGVAVEGGLFNTDGYPIVAPRERGPIDVNANVKYRNVNAKLDYTANERFNAFFRAGYFTEDRINGKVGEVNDTKWTAVSGGVQMRLPDDSELQARLFVDTQKSHFNFLNVTNPSTTRNSVRLATDQHVPTNGVGYTVQWARPIKTHAFSAGTDWRWVDGDSQEDAYVAVTPLPDPLPLTQPATLSVQRVSGGSQQILGGFLQDVFSPLPQMVVTLSARVDHWRNYDGHFLETTVATGLPTANNKPSLPDRTDTVVSPRAAVLYHFTNRISGWGAFSTGFRAPTLTELYRQFAVGAVTTRPNDQLGPEHLKGGEAGINVAPARNVTVRATWFDNHVRDPVSNVTLSASLAQKQNLGATRIWGMQTDAEYRFASAWRVAGAYMYDQAKVTDGGAANPALVGKFLPQVPEHRGSAQVSYANAKYVNVAVGLQFVGRQFDDDLNVRAIPPATLTEAGYDATVEPGLPGYRMVDLTVSRAITRNVEAFFGVQNVFDRVTFVQTAPSTTGVPRLVNGGVRLRFNGR